MPAAKSPTRLKPAEIAELFQQGVSLHQFGHLEQAEFVYGQILAAQPRHIDTLHLMGVLHGQTGRTATGIAYLRQAIGFNGLQPAFHSNLGNVLMAAGDARAALTSYDRAAALQPGFAEAQANRGNALQALERFDEAVAACDTALRLQPALPEVWNNRANALARLARFDEALQSIEQALKLRPDHPEALANRGSILAQMGRGPQALHDLQRAIALTPDNPRILSNLGALQRELGQVAESLDTLERAHALHPADADVCSHLALSLQESGRLDEALQRHRQAMALAPTRPGIVANGLYALTLSGQADSPEYRDTAVQLERVLLERARPLSSWARTPGTLPDAPLNVGLLSGDLRQHPVGAFLAGMLGQVNPARIHLHAFPTTAQTDELGQRLRAQCASWTPVAGLSDEAAARRIHDAGIDLLIDLSGYTAGHRAGVLAWRPAPVQLSWLGYLASSGLHCVDALLADPVTAPEGCEAAFTETLWRLPETANCHTPPAGLPDIGPLPARQRGHLTFGSVQNPAKVGDAVLRTWARVLKAVPTARLRLQNRQFDLHRGVEAFTQRMTATGWSADLMARVDLMPSVPGQTAYVASMAEVDLMLDTFPYPGITTTCEALWMGVPTLTMQGHDLLSRQGASLMRQAGLPDWVCADEDAYVAQAARIAGDLSALEVWRFGLRTRLAALPLFNAEVFARQWEDALLQGWLSTQPSSRQMASTGAA